MQEKFGMGCQAPRYDARDYHLNQNKVHEAHAFPMEYTIYNMPSVKNQWSVSSCVAHAISSILEFHTGCTEELSTNFIYGIQDREFGRNKKGMYLGDACKIVKKYGDMLEKDCPGNYEVPIAHRAAEEAYKDDDKMDRAYKYRIASYYTCKTIDDIKYAVYHHGPVLASIRWYKNYRVGMNGLVRGEPKGNYGYHAVVIYGYTIDGFLCQNSWGKLWGKGGRFFLPYSQKIQEAKALVDYVDDEEIVSPKRNSWLDLIYKIINEVVNVIWELKL